VGSIKQPDGRYTQTGKETLTELYRDPAEIKAAKPESICCSQGGLGTVYSGH